MTKHWLAAVLLTLSAPLASETPAPADLPGWMAGAWEMKVGEGWNDEFWTPPRGGIMIGAARIGKFEKLESFEHTRIVRKADGSMSYFAQPGGAPPTEFPLTASGPQMIEFTNPAHDYPQKVKYWREGGQLIAEISLADGSQPMRWTYRPMGR